MFLWYNIKVIIIIIITTEVLYESSVKVFKAQRIHTYAFEIN